MFYLILAILSSAMVSIVMRLSQGKVRNDLGMLVMNYLMCSLLGAGSAGLSCLTSPSGQYGAAAAMGCCNGILYLVSFVLFQVNVQRNGVVLSATFMKLGLLVTMLVSVLLYGEIPGPWKTLGFLVAVAAIVLINYKKEAGTAGFKAGLLWLLLCGGMADAMSKIFEESGITGMGDLFLFFTFFAALILCFAYMRSKGQRIGLQEILFGLLIGIPNFYSSRFLLGALGHIAAVIVYPVYSVGTILVVTLTGLVFFRERLSSRQWVALGMILSSLVLLNL